jgi:hypothetical protein
MSELQTTASPRSFRNTRLRTAARWLVTFIGFPLGGLTAELVAGPVDSLTAALLGGLITGLFIGAAQAWGLGLHHNVRSAAEWTGATALGLMIGLGIGATAVGYDTSLRALVIQGTISGLAVGIAQAVVLRARLGRLALAWPPALAVIWAIGWAVTTTFGVQVSEQFTVFGSSGAIVVTAMTALLPLIVNRQSATNRSEKSV